MRLLVVSNRAPFCASVGRVVRVPEVCVVSYDYQSANLQGITQLVKDGLGNHLVASIALLLHCDNYRMFICYQNNKCLDPKTLHDDPSIQTFLSELASNLIPDNDGLHIFNSPRIMNLEAFLKQASNLLSCHVELVTDLFGPVSQQAVTQKYFFISELKHLIQTRERMLETEVVQVACGDHHCMSLTAAGQVWAWGRGQDGRLGLGKEQDCSVPTLVPIPHHVTVSSVHCGPDCSAVLTHSGAVLACGHNTHNKLGFNTSVCGLNVITVDKSLTLQLVRALSSHHIVSVSLAVDHSAVLTKSGQVLTMGSNAEAQAGHSAEAPRLVDSLADVIINDVVCGPTYTMVVMIQLPHTNTCVCLRTINMTLEGYEKLRSVGKGAFGTAVLYRRVASDSLVVIKEINMLELTAAERQMALNEVQVLSSLLHPNIIRYLGSFEHEGVLMIEMEYADGGTLAQLIHRGIQLSEQEVLTMFLQCVAAIRYMHQNNILHRDLKTANVFLTKNRVIKVGDFGISKIMSTKNQAHTVLGTPYYISPEMCEGKQYDNKSDVWALGCILYEMACLHKTFQGSNLPALVNKIMKGTFEPVPRIYSVEFRDLVNHLLQKDPTLRPTAAETYDILNLLLDQTPNNTSQPVVHKGIRSILYQISGCESTFTCVPLPFPPNIRITQIAVSNTHYIAVSEDATVFTWGEGKRGQLGHPEPTIWIERPTPVHTLANRQILSVGAGDGYSAFLSASGVLMTCGDGTFGCLGQGEWNNSVTPRALERMLETEVVQVACGDHHCMSLTAAGQVWAWGRGQDGRLGLGKEQDCSVPTLVPIPHHVTVSSVHCGPDCSAVLTHSGAVLACGHNTHNKLGFNTTVCGLNVITVDKSLTLQLVRALSSHHIVSVSLAVDHSAVLTKSGQVLTMGSNAEAQAGHSAEAPRLVDSLADVIINDVVCGPTYTMVVSVFNAVYFWGTRYTGSSTEIVSQPRLTLALYASPSQVAQGDTLRVVSVRPLWDMALVLIDTTLPVPRGSRLDPSVEYDSIGPIPEWITAELAEADDPWQG